MQNQAARADATEPGLFKGAVILHPAHGTTEVIAMY